MLLLLYAAYGELMGIEPRMGGLIDYFFVSILVICFWSTYIYTNF